MEITDAQIEEAIRQLPHIPAEYRKVQAGTIAGWLYPRLGTWSAGWSRNGGDANYRHREDLVQVAALAVLEALIDYVAGTRHQNVEQWLPYVNRLAAYATKRWLKSSAVQPLAGLVNHQRRIARVPHSLSALRHELAREPSAAELVEYHNTEMYRRHGNPVRQGSLITLADAQAVLRR
jgi:hypothetical protein